MTRTSTPYTHDGLLPVAGLLPDDDRPAGRNLVVHADREAVHDGDLVDGRHLELRDGVEVLFEGLTLDELRRTFDAGAVGDADGRALHGGR